MTQRSSLVTVLGVNTAKTQWRPTTRTVTTYTHPQDARTDNEAIIACALRDVAKEMAQLKAGAPAVQDEPDFTFGGWPTEDPEKYLGTFEDWLQSHPSACYAHVATRTLEAGAHDWFRTVHFADMEWNLFVAQFIAKYNFSATKANLLRELYGRTQGPYEDVYSFIVNKWSLFIRLRPETQLQERLQTIQELLLPRVLAITSGTTFYSLQHLLEITNQIETDLREEQQRLKLPLYQMRRDAEVE